MINIENRKGNYSKHDKSKMFLSWQTHEGLLTTAKSLIECVNYLLKNGMKYVRTEVFCQDRLENNFGKQRAIGRRRKDNPNLRDFGYNDNIIKSQFTIRPLGGNVRSQHTEQKIDNTPLPKRRKCPSK